jgi:hypothetical protein
MYNYGSTGAGYGLNSTMGGIQSGIGGAMNGGGYGGAAKGIGINAGMQGLGQVPYAGPFLQGTAQGAMSGGLPSPQFGADQKNQLNQYGLSAPDEPKAPGASSMGRRIGRGIGSAAFGTIPYIGPFLQAGAQINNQRMDRRNAQKFQQSMQGQGSKMQQNLALAGQRQNAMRMAANRQTGKVRVAPQGMAPGTPGQNMVAPMTTAASTAANSSAPGTSDPWGTQQAWKQSKKHSKGSHTIMGQSAGILADLLRQGLDPRILSGLENAATRSAQDTRQTLQDTFARTGDTSGYNSAIPAGMDMSLANQLAQIEPNFLQQRQQWEQDLIGAIRGTRRGAMPPQPRQASMGTDWGSIMGGVGALGNAATNMYSASRTAPNGPVTA